MVLYSNDSLCSVLNYRTHWTGLGESSTQNAEKSETCQSEDALFKLCLNKQKSCCYLLLDII